MGSKRRKPPCPNDSAGDRRAARALPMLSCDDYRVVEAYGQVYRLEKSEPVARRVDAAAKGRWWERIWCLMSLALPARAKIRC